MSWAAIIELIIALKNISAELDHVVKFLKGNKMISNQLVNNVAVLGTGRIGHSLAKRLLNLDYSVHVYNRTIEKTKVLKKLNAKVYRTPKDAIQHSLCTMVTLADGEAIKSVLFNTETLKAMKGRTVIQMSTVSSEESQLFHNKLEQHGAKYIEAPLMAGPSDMENATGTILIGSSKELFDQWQWLFHEISTKSIWIGDVGKATVLKLALNQFIASLVCALGFSLNMVSREDIPSETMMNILRDFPYYAPSFDSKWDRIQNQDYTSPKFTAHLMLKDIGLIAKEAERLGVSAATIDGLENLYEKAVENGYGDLDYSAVYKAFVTDSHQG